MSIKEKIELFLSPNNDLDLMSELELSNDILYYFENNGEPVKIFSPLTQNYELVYMDNGTIKFS